MAVKKSKRGGKRAGAGRKSDKELFDLHKMIDSAVPIREQAKIIKNLALMAATDSLAAYRFLTLRYGLPTQRQEMDADISVYMDE